MLFSHVSVHHPGTTRRTSASRIGPLRVVQGLALSDAYSHGLSLVPGGGPVSARRAIDLHRVAFSMGVTVSAASSPPLAVRPVALTRLRWGRPAVQRRPCCPHLQRCRSGCSTIGVEAAAGHFAECESHERETQCKQKPAMRFGSCPPRYDHGTTCGSDA